MKNKLQILILLLYSALSRFFTSLYSIRFDKVVMEVDGACFYNVGKAIMNGKVLYKDVFDHKPPYIFFINAIASIVDFNHIGLFIVETMVLFFTLYYMYKFLKIIFSNLRGNNDLFLDNSTIEMLSLTGTFILSIFLSLRNVYFGYCRTEEFAVAFTIPALYIFARYCYNEIDINEISKKMFIIGILAGLTLMTNFKAVIVFVPFILPVAYEMIVKKDIKLLIKTFFIGLLGVLASMMPYIIYMILTDSFDDMIYAVIYTNWAYLSSSIDMVITTENGVLNVSANENLLKFIIIFTSRETLILILTYISAVLIFTMKYNKKMKYVASLQIIFTFLYIMVPKRLHTYYLFSLIPFFIVIYIFIIKIISDKFLSKINTDKIFIIVASVVFIITLFISYIVNRKAIFITSSNHLSRAQRMQKVIEENYQGNYHGIKDLKVLGVGFIPEVYTYLNANIDYKYFILPSVNYDIDRTVYQGQYEYIKNSDPDIIIFLDTKSLTRYPEDLKKDIGKRIDENYIYIGEVSTNANEGTYFIFAKL